MSRRARILCTAIVCGMVGYAACAGFAASVGFQEPDTAFVLVRAKGTYPTPLHQAVWDMVGNCLGITNTPTKMIWAVADTMLGLPSRRLAYGLTVQVPDQWPAIFIMRPFWFNPTVLSHEIIHLRAGVPDHVPELENCMMYTGVAVAPQVVPEKVVAELLERDDVVVLHRRR